MKSFEFGGSEYAHLEDLRPFYASSKDAQHLDSSHSVASDKHDSVMYPQTDVNVPLHFDNQSSLPLRMMSGGHSDGTQHQLPSPHTHDSLNPTTSHFYHMLHEHMPADLQRGSEHTNYDTFISSDKPHAQPMSDMLTLDMAAPFTVHPKLSPVGSHAYVSGVNMPVDDSNPECTPVNTMPPFPVRGLLPNLLLTPCSKRHVRPSNRLPSHRRVCFLK